MQGARTLENWMLEATLDSDDISSLLAVYIRPCMEKLF